MSCVGFRAALARERKRFADIDAGRINPTAPRWIPADDVGEHWKFVSYKGRYLGTVCKVEEVFLSEKFCCARVETHARLHSAAARVETTLSCSECLSERRTH